MTKEYIFVCEITWGCIPIDTSFIFNSNLFKENLDLFNKGKWKELFLNSIKVHEFN